MTSFFIEMMKNDVEMMNVDKNDDVFNF